MRIHVSHGRHFNGRHFNGLQIAGMVVLGTITAVLIAFVFGFFVRWLWNWLMPPLFHLSTITYWQGFGLILLGRLLFGTVGHHAGRGRHHWRRHECDCDEDDWKIKGSWHNWDHYDDWWRAEGRAAFEKFVEAKGGVKEDGESEE